MSLTFCTLVLIVYFMLELSCFFLFFCFVNGFRCFYLTNKKWIYSAAQACLFRLLIRLAQSQVLQVAFFQGLAIFERIKRMGCSEF